MISLKSVQPICPKLRWRLRLNLGVFPKWTGHLLPVEKQYPELSFQYNGGENYEFYQVASALYVIRSIKSWYEESEKAPILLIHLRKYILQCSKYLPQNCKILAEGIGAVICESHINFTFFKIRFAFILDACIKSVIENGIWVWLA